MEFVVPAAESSKYSENSSHIIHSLLSNELLRKYLCIFYQEFILSIQTTCCQAEADPHFYDQTLKIAEKLRSERSQGTLFVSGSMHEWKVGDCATVRFFTTAYALRGEGQFEANLLISIFSLQIK